MSDRIEALAGLCARLGQEETEYLAAYDAACSLAIFVEHIEAGWPPRIGSPLVEGAKVKLRKLAALHGDFFTRFERVAEEWIGD